MIIKKLSSLFLVLFFICFACPAHAEQIECSDFEWWPGDAKEWFYPADSKGIPIDPSFCDIVWAGQPNRYKAVKEAYLSAVSERRRENSKNSLNDFWENQGAKRSIRAHRVSSRILSKAGGFGIEYPEISAAYEVAKALMINYDKSIATLRGRALAAMKGANDHGEIPPSQMYRVLNTFAAHRKALDSQQKAIDELANWIRDLINAIQSNSRSVGDFDGDRDLDLVYITRSNIVRSQIRVGLRFKTTSFALPVGQNAKVALVNIDSDEKVDLIVTENGSKKEFIGVGDGTFQPLFKPQTWSMKFFSHGRPMRVCEVPLRETFLDVCVRSQDIGASIRIAEGLLRVTDAGDIEFIFDNASTVDHTYLSAYFLPTATEANPEKILFANLLFRGEHYWNIGNIQQSREEDAMFCHFIPSKLYENRCFKGQLEFREGQAYAPLGMRG